MEVLDASRSVAGGLEVDITVAPNSDRQGIEGMNEWRKRLIMRVRSPPLDGKANVEIEEYMENVTGCRSEIIKGQKSRQKTLMIHGDPKEIISSLEALI